VRNIACETTKYIKTTYLEKNMNKKGDLPFWLVMLIWILLGAAVVLFIIKLSGDKMAELIGRLG
jgi:uncharacterized membrane protein YhaH (DUF805 family)